MPCCFPDGEVETKSSDSEALAWSRPPHDTACRHRAICTERRELSNSENFKKLASNRGYEASYRFAALKC